MAPKSMQQTDKAPRGETDIETERERETEREKDR